MQQPQVLVDNTQGLKFTESPRWRDGRWWFLDIHGQAIKSTGPGGDLRTELNLPFKPNSLGFRRDGSLVFCDALQRHVYCWDGGEMERLADISTSTVFCLSDGVVDAQDRLYVGDIGYNFFDPANQPVDTCVITCVEPDGRHKVVATGLSFPNGMAITPDGQTLIVAETMGGRLTSYDIGDDGTLSNRRVFAQLPQGVHPDGIALDAEGAVWLACPEYQPTVMRVREGGQLVERVMLDTHAYAVMLGGSERHDLLICTSDTHNPVEIAAAPSARLQMLEVQVPGAGKP